MHKKLKKYQEGDVIESSKGTWDWLGSNKFSQATQLAMTLGNTVQATAKHQLDPTSAAIKQAGTEALGMIPPPVGPALQAVSAGTSMLTGALGKNLEGVSKADEFISSLPIVGDLAGLASSRLPDFSYDPSKIANDFSTTSLDKATDLSGKNVLFGKKNAMKTIEEGRRKARDMAAITKENQKHLQNNMTKQYTDINNFRFSGQNQTLSLSAKQGVKFPELDEARKIISSNKREIPKHQNGGIIENQNIIPSGALHARKHEITSINPELKGKITEKGIPVISQAEGGEIQQQAEIEENEIILSKSTTNTIEELFERYKKASDKEKDEIAIEAGKFLTEEILKNTNDQTGLIKEVE